MKGGGEKFFFVEFLFFIITWPFMCWFLCCYSLFVVFSVAWMTIKLIIFVVKDGGEKFFFVEFLFFIITWPSVCWFCLCCLLFVVFPVALSQADWSFLLRERWRFLRCCYSWLMIVNWPFCADVVCDICCSKSYFLLHYHKQTDHFFVVKDGGERFSSLNSFFYLYLTWILTTCVLLT